MPICLPSISKVKKFERAGWVGAAGMGSISSGSAEHLGGAVLERQRERRELGVAGAEVAPRELRDEDQAELPLEHGPAVGAVEGHQRVAHLQRLAGGHRQPV